MFDRCYRCRPYPCRELIEIEQCRDSESVESEEIVADVGAPGRGKRVRQTTRRPRTMEDDDQMNTRRNQSMMNYTRRGSGGSAGGSGGSGGCPGSLEDCIAACPSSVRAFKVCTANSDRRCSKKWRYLHTKSRQNECLQHFTQSFFLSWSFYLRCLYYILEEKRWVSTAMSMIVGDSGRDIWINIDTPKGKSASLSLVNHVFLI